MSDFFIWAGATLVLLSAYFVFLWRRSRNRSRFRAKLSIIFLLFVLIPTVPLTFLVAHLLTRSVRVLLLPGIGEALDTSLETIRLQVEERGKLFLEAFDPSVNYTPNILEEEKIDLLGIYRFDRDSVITLHSIRLQTSLLPENWTPQRESLVDLLTTERTSRLISLGEGSMITVYRPLSDSTFAVAGYPVETHVLKARDDVVRALDIYNTLSLLKESIIEKNLLWILALLLVVGLAVLAVITARKFSRGISEPVQDLVKGMELVADGDLSHQVYTRAKDEFRFLVDSFNKMIHDLAVSRRKLIRAERMAAWQEIARRISHEMKNSLTPVSISLRRFQNHIQQESLPPALEQSLQDIQEELHGLEVMAKEFSTFARMPLPQKSPLDLNEVVQSVVRLAEFSSGQVNVRTNLAAHLPLINADREQMKRLLTNLIKNGIEASRGNGTVMITTGVAASSEHAVKLVIQDQGEGIDSETLDKIFHPYYTTKEKGTGLGLAIVQKIVEDHDGEIRIESEKGKGTRVIVSL
ncbi:HAMP domain-containing protein [bacterium]|nr:HAMP domain-containing protein [bacterium]